MAIKIQGTTVLSDARELQNIASIDATSTTSIEGVIDGHLTAGTGISYASGTISHSDTSSATSVNNSGNTFIQDLTIDGNGHVTAIGSGTTSINDAIITLSAGTGLSGGGDFTTNQSGNETITLNLDLSELVNYTSYTGTTEFIARADNGQGTFFESRKAASSIDLSIFNNDAGFTTNTGTVTSVTVTAGTGLSGGGTVTGAGSVTLGVDLAELTDMTAGMVGTDEFIVLDVGQQGGENRRKAANEIGLSIFNNDAGFTTNIGDITEIQTGQGISGGGTSGQVSISLDLSNLPDFYSYSSSTEFAAYTSTGQGFSNARKAASQIGLSIFNNDAGFTTYDSANTLGLVDSAYVNARVGAGTDEFARTVAFLGL